MKQRSEVVYYKLDIFHQKLDLQSIEQEEQNMKNTFIICISGKAIHCSNNVKREIVLLVVYLIFMNKMNQTISRLYKYFFLDSS